MTNITKLFLILILLSLMPALYGQTARVNISGRVLNQQGEPLTGATVVLLNAADSVLVNFAMTNQQGQFTLRRVESGDYLLQASYLGYKKYSKALTVDAARGDFDVEDISMTEAETTLDEVEIKGERTPIFFKKDTVEYNAEAFKTQPNATVEDLLKKLPGVEVEDDGTIKAQGEEVQKVMVDGKEFFGNDPQMATKNLPADVVDRVQVFDKQSEMAEFTGIDDGEREKTINLELKENSKLGVFGRVAAGFGPRQDNDDQLQYDRFETKFNVNRFTKKMQLSLIGLGNNVNQQGFSVNDYVSFMGGMQGLMRGGRGARIRIGGDGGGSLPIADGRSDGFSDTYAGGINFNYDLSKKTRINTSYLYNNIIKNTEQLVFRENFLNNRNFFTDETSDERSQSANHRLNMRLDHKIDSFKQVTFTGSASVRDGENDNLSQLITTNAEGLRENSSFTDNEANAQNLSVNAELTYKQRFRKRGRSFVVEASVNAGDNEQNADLYSLNQFFPDDPRRSFADTIWQNQFQQDDQFNYGLELSYTEPVGRRKYLSFEYTHRNFTYNLKKDFFDIEDFGVRNEIFNPELSNQYSSDYLYDNGGLSLLFNGEKSNLTLGMEVQNSRLKGELTVNGPVNIDNSYLNLLPSISWNYDLGQSKRLRFRYSTSVQEPSITQLQPLVDNSDPLNIYVGNPQLRPSYSHRARLNFFSFSQFSFTSIFAFLNATYTQNPIVNATRVDSLFRQVTQPINVDESFRLTLYGGTGFPIRPINARVNFNANVSYNNSILFVNEVENITNRLTTGGSLSIENQNKDVFDLVVGLRLSHNLTEYSVSDELNQSWLTQRYFTNLTVNFAKTWAVSTNFSYRIFGGDAFTDKQTIALWEASLSKFLFKNKRGQLELAAYDLLNQNKGITRSSELNYVEEQRINSLSRFFLLRFTFNLSRFGANPNEGNFQITRFRR